MMIGYNADDDDDGSDDNNDDDEYDDILNIICPFTKFREEATSIVFMLPAFLVMTIWITAVASLLSFLSTGQLEYVVRYLPSK